jgi:hypothetical protein
MKMKLSMAVLLVTIGAVATVATSARSEKAEQVSEYGPRTGRQADAVKRATSVLADRSLQELMRTNSNSRNDIQLTALALQADAVASLCVELIRNRRPGTELRDAISELTGLVRRAPVSSPQSSLWRSVQSEVDGLNRELSGGYQPGWTGGGTSGARPIVGRLSWNGRVDDTVRLVIRGASVEQQTIAGAQMPEGRYNFTSPLPGSAMEVSVTKQSGRGSVRVLQQPSRSNNFTAVIEIRDDKGGAQDYRIEVTWR